MNISQYHSKIAVIVHRLTLKPILEQMTYPLVFHIIPVDIFPADSLEHGFQRFSADPDEKVYMIAHQAVCVQPEHALLSAFLKDLKKMLLILVVLEDRLLIDSTKHHMIYSAFCMFSCFSGHVYTSLRDFSFQEKVCRYRPIALSLHAKSPQQVTAPASSTVRSDPAVGGHTRFFL